MAAEEKAGGGKLESEDGKGNTEVKEGNGVAKSPVKHVNGSEEPASLPASGKEESSVQEAKVNGVEKSPVAPVNGVGESPTGSPGKEAVIKEVDSKEQNGKKPEEGKDEESKEAEQDDEGPEGSTFLDTEHFVWSTRFVIDTKLSTLIGVTKGEGEMLRSNSLLHCNFIPHFQHCGVRFSVSALSHSRKMSSSVMTFNCFNR